jgi:nucleotide-binding universal stress UspA family protein
MASRRLRVLVAVDFSTHSEGAVAWAADFSRRAGASLMLVHVRPTSDVRAAVAEDRGDLLRASAAALGRAVRKLYRERLGEAARRVPGARVKLLHGRPSTALAREAARGYDVMVMGSRGRGAVAATLLGSTTQEALRSCPIPVAVVRAG